MDIKQTKLPLEKQETPKKDLYSYLVGLGLSSLCSHTRVVILESAHQATHEGAIQRYDDIRLIENNEDEMNDKNRQAKQRAAKRVAFVNSSPLFTRPDISARSNLGKMLQYIKNNAHVTKEDDEYDLLKMVRTGVLEYPSKKILKIVKGQIEEMQKVFEVFEYGY